MLNMLKSASAYPPGMKGAPKQGFGLSTTAADFGQMDPYQAYTNAQEDEQIFSLLQTEAGRQALGA